MAKVAAFPREIAVTVPQGFPRARVSAANKRARDLMADVQAVGGIVAAVEMSPEGAVKVWTTAAPLAALSGRGSDWD